MLSDNFKYSSYVEYDYDTMYDCHSNYLAEDEYNSCRGICRCGRIVDTRVTSVDTWGLAKDISSNKDDLLLIYCIDRVLVANRIYDTDNWDFDITGGYYGEELRRISLYDNTTLNTAIEHLLNQDSDSNKVKFALVEEYGYLLDTIKDLEFSIELVKREDIIIPNKNYANQSGPGIYKASSYEGPRGVLREEDGRLILIDGYHRYAAFEEDEMKMVVGRHGKGQNLLPNN